MNKISLKNVTLMGIDCVDFNRLQKVADISMEGIDFAEVKLLTSIKNDDPRWVAINHIGTIEAYSEFCIKELLHYVITDFVLLIQHDGFIINPRSWDDRFLKYDYIGAPLHIKGEHWFKRRPIPREFEGSRVVGNGGFSLRSKKFIQASARLAAQGRFSTYHPEDLVLCLFNQTLLLNEGIRFAPYKVARKFSVEDYNDIYRYQFGFHSLKYTDISDWIGKNPQHGIVLTHTRRRQSKYRWLRSLLVKLRRLYQS